MTVNGVAGTIFDIELLPNEVNYILVRFILKMKETPFEDILQQIELKNLHWVMEKFILRGWSEFGLWNLCPQTCPEDRICQGGRK